MSEFDLKKFSEDLKKLAKQDFGSLGELAKLVDKGNLSVYTQQEPREPKASFLYKLAEQNIDINKLLTGKSYQDKSIEERLNNIEKNFSESSKSIFTRHLSAMWNFFISRNWTDKNIIIKVKSTKTNTMPIPFKEMQKILTYYHEKNREQYFLVYFLLLTGMRPSSALVVSWEDVDLENKILVVNNVKGKRTFNFPIHSELMELLQEIGIKKKGKIFLYTTPPKFFNIDCKKMFIRGNLGHPYTFYQLRNTFSSWLVNKGVNISTLQKLLDHTDQRITDKHYTKFELDYLRNEIEKTNFKEKPKKKP